MNILLLATDFFPVWGGAGTYASELARNIDPGIELHILTLNRINFGKLKVKSKDNIENILPKNVHIHYLGEARDTFWYNLKFQISCLKNIDFYVKNYDIDIIHSQSSMPDLFINHNNLKIPVVTTVHSTIEEQAKAIKALNKGFHQLELSEKMSLLLSYFDYFIEKNYYKNNKYYITVSDWSKEQLVKNKKIDPNRVRVIKNGVDVELFNPKRGLSTHMFYPELSLITKPKILFLSRMTESKGLTFLMESIPSILRDSDVHFIFAGPGKRPNFKLSSKNYTYLNYVPHEVCPYLYSTSDIFILPSLYENFPISILEAMASGCAIVASDVGGIPEMISDRENGLLISPSSIKDITNSISTLLGDKILMQKLKINARKTAEEKFTLNNTISNTIKYYNEIIK